MSEVVYNREASIQKAVTALGLSDKRKEEVVKKADSLVSKPDSSWYKSTLEKAQINNEDFYYRAMREANYVLYKGDPEKDYKEDLPKEDQYGAAPAQPDGVSQLIAEFDGDRQKDLLSVETVLPGRSIHDHDWLYINIYSEDELIDTHWEWIKGNGNINIEDDDYINIDFFDLLVNDYGYNPASYRIEYCVKRKAAWPNEWARVAEISKNKMEVRVDAIHEEALINLRPSSINGEYYAPMDIYHKDAGFIKAVDWVYDEYHKDENLIFKLSNKIDRKIKVGDQIEIWDEIVSTKSVEINLVIDVEKNLEPYVELRSPNVTLDVNRDVAKPTAFESWDQILSATASVNSQTINAVLSQSTGAELNIDYRKFENFIHFSSAKERVTNFQYKMALIEFYESKSISVGVGLDGQISSSVTGSEVYVSLSADYSLQRNNVIGTFDEYEKYLYYESASLVTENSQSYYPSSWPKSSTNEIGVTPSVKPHANLSVSASAVQTWLTGSLDSASFYDENNMHILRKTIPATIRYDSNNSGFMLFVDMVSQHFDILYNYIDKLNTQRERNENLSVGISRDLIFDSLKSFGWKPSSGYDLDNIWEYWLGYNDTGSYQQSSSAEFPGIADAMNYVVTESLSKRDLELEPLSRVINNLPYILKTKGTSQGLRALLNCYGIPSSFFKVQEFGGPDPLRNPTSSHMREIDIQNYGLTFKGGGSTDAYLSGSWGNSNSTMELRFKTNTSGSNMSQSLFNAKTQASADGYNAVWIEPSASTEGNKWAYIRYHVSVDPAGEGVSGSLGKLPILDNDWWNLMIRHNDSLQTVTLKCQKAPDHADGDITHVSESTIACGGALVRGFEDSALVAFTLGHETDTWFSGSQKLLKPFSGSMQEFRTWTCELEDNAFDLHTKAPSSTVGNSYTSSFDDLRIRLPLGTDLYTPTTESMGSGFSSSHTDQGTDQPLNYLVGSFEWDLQEEEYYVTTPNAFGLNPTARKIRIEDNTINDILDPFKSQESSSSDTNPIDQPDLYVSISPQDDIDIDIGLQFGAVNLDDLIGDPRNRWSKEYPDLRTFRDYYFKKFSGPQNLQAFIRSIKYINAGLFKQIDFLLPARGTNVVGLMIKPTVLERPKISAEPSFSLSEVHYGKTNQAMQNLEHYTQSIDCFNENAMSSSDDYDAMLYTFDNDGSYAQQWFSTLTDTVPLPSRDPNKYSFDITTLVSGTLTDSTFTQTGVMEFATDQPYDHRYYETIYTYGSALSASLHLWTSSSYSPARIVQQDDFIGFKNSFYFGCKMASADFNTPSTDTIDGGPVVEFIEGNPNTLISKDDSFSGEIDVR